MVKNKNRIFLFFFILFAVVVLYLFPFSSNLLKDGGRDKIAHFTLFTILGFVSSTINTFYFIFTVVVSIVLEFLQIYIPFRNFEFPDLVINLIGTFVGAFFYKFYF